ncbi:permease family protein, putative [Ichthyophthirius multifiliis]|uniref:Permease family protein, putative n=1 Tax=Ichthyophthirius multifiliis TaxID=5932 RepID=G0R191_ICHMU|nr:permease family protein, putative [Ichthyophthirius multifiliis]EGR28776.1 permease family protein, putative [Ichthyophthirius multifiliis]|eukprot:XP_004030012.1 permease family protein, putative [Ichthyophthirius multifiliis]
MVHILLLQIQLKIYLDSQGIKANSKQLLEPVIGDGNLKETSESLKEEAQKLPDDFVLNSTVLADQITPVVMRALNFTQNYTIQKAIESPNGKWAENLGNVIVVDQLDVLVYIWEGFEKELKRAQQQQQQNIGNTQTINLVNILLNSGLQNSLKQFIRSINIQEYAVLSNMVFNNRMGIYNSEDVIKKNIISISNKFYKNYGQKKAMQSTVPLSTIVIGLLILKLFLDNMIATSIFLLFMLAVLLIYSLMISDVEEKTYEFGMLRALGFQKNSLVYLLIIQGLIFAIPGLCLGLLMAYLLNSIIAFIIFDKAVMTTTYDLHWSAIALAIFLGIFIPLISVYLPIQRAMSKTLRDSLDLYHRVVNQISVSVQKLEKLGISFSQSVNAFTLILMGIVCYYIAPAAFVFKKLDLFLAIINIVLIMMIIGFTLLLNLSQKYVERVFVKLFLCIFRKEKHLEIVIVKNMNGHRRRNSKTAIMYTIALAFLIFTGAGFSLQSKQIQDNLKSSLGTDFKVQLINDKTGLDERGMREYMEEYIKRNPTHINGYSFITFSMKEFPKFKNSKLSSLSQFPSLKNLDIKGVEKNYLQSSYLDFYYPTQFDPNYKFKTISNNGNDVNDCVESLFSQEGNLNIQKSTDVFKIISNAQYRKQDQINPIPDFQVDYNSNTNKKIINKGQSEKRFTSSKYKDEEINVILPSGLKYAISLDVNTPALLEFSGIRYRTKIRCMANKFSGFKFSSYRQIQFYGESLTGIEQFKYIIDSYYYYSGHASNPEVKYFFEKVQPGSSYGIPKQSLLIKFKKNLSKFEREDLANGLRNYFKNDFTQLFDVPQIVESIEQTLFFIDLFSLVVAGISIILSFFLILVSFVSNIKENSWEFGVLRAIGLNKRQITRVYMIESCVLVLSSGFIGTVIGITVAVTLTLQFLMFTELPFVFVFPYKMFFTTFLSGFLIAVFGSYFALTEFKDKPISTIVKGLI